MASDKEVSYVPVDEGRVDEVFEDVESVDCLSSEEDEHSTLIVRHSDSPPNTTRKNVDHLVGFVEVETEDQE